MLIEKLYKTAEKWCIHLVMAGFLAYIVWTTEDNTITQFVNGFITGLNK